MAFDYASVIRGGGAVLFILLGAFLILRRPRTRNVMAWGIAYVVYGVARVTSNLQALLAPDQAVPPLQLLWGTTIPQFVLASVAAFLLVDVVRPQSRTARRTIGVLSGGWALLLLGLALHDYFAQLSALPAAVSESELAGLSLYFASNYLVALAYGMLWVGLLEALRQGLPRAGGQLLVAFALMQLVLSEAMLALDLPLWIAAGMLPLDVWAFMACTLGAMALVPLAWSFRLFNGPASRLVLNLFLGLVVFAIALRLSFAAEFMSPAAYATGAVVGILRILSLLVAGYAILRTDFLPTKLASTTARRGSLAGLALAALFITAQVLQNLLGDRLGLLWGGVVAGAVVFASFPLQRAAERRLGTGTKAEDSFRAAVRLALRDSKLTPEEERDLVVLAHQLGLPPDRAYAILQDEGRGPAKPGAAPSH